MSKKLLFRLFLAAIVAFLLYRFFTHQPEYTLTHITGQTMGTIEYHVKYMGDDVPNYKKEIDSILVAFNQSLSTYIEDSEISLLNRSGVLNNPSDMFLEVLNKSQFVYETTDGAFDPTIGPVVNAWGFGPDKQPTLPDSTAVDSLLMKVGFSKVTYVPEKIEMLPGMYLDFSAIAKGYAVDLVADFLENKGFTNYMVEIGGEVRTMGENEKNEIWKIGIEDPLVGLEERKLKAIVSLRDGAMATSGNYRNYYESNGKIIAHTIDPRTGYNTRHNLLSASVFAEDCMSADAYATAFMVLGYDAAVELTKFSDLDAFLIYRDKNDSIRTYASPGIAQSITPIEGQ